MPPLIVREMNRLLNDMTEDPQNNEIHSRSPDKTPATAEPDKESIIQDPAESYRRALDANSDMPLAPTIILYTIAGLFVFFLIWANLATLDEVTRGEGRVIPSTKVKTVQGVDKGQVEQIFVKEGDIVEKGQPLLSIKATQARSTFLSNQSRVQGLQAKIIRLEAEVNGREVLSFPPELRENAPQYVAEERRTFQRSKERLESQLNTIDSQISQKQQEVREIESQIRDLKEVIALSKEEMDLIKPLVESGAAPKVELIQLERAMKEKQSEINKLQESLPRARSALQEARARREEVLTKARSEAQELLSDTLLEMQSIKEKLAAFKDVEDRTTLISPVNGIVQSINENLGGVVEPGEELVEIVPEDDSLLIEARIKPSDIAFLHPGQDAKIKITAYDFSIYGGLDGKLVDISPDSITDRQGNTYYRVRLRSNSNTLVHQGRELPIIAGMVANVDILTGKKTVMEYLLKPFFKTMNNALNER